MVEVVSICLRDDKVYYIAQKVLAMIRNWVQGDFFVIIYIYYYHIHICLVGLVTTIPHMRVCYSTVNK